MEIEHFLDEIAPRLETARVLEHELDRNLARRFNVLDYLRDDELGLSRVIADLLNAKASHGQGALFLWAFLGLEGVKNTQDWPNLDKSQISVVVERTIRAARRVDIFVEIVDSEKKYCLAIENKPYAGDQKNQVKDYLEFLKGRYDDRFLLIYLSPTGDGPSEWSIPKEELHQWKGRLAVMPYYGGGEKRADEFDDFRLRPQHSLADWLGECRKKCEVDRLRWFLRDAETFCQRTFGGQEMTTESETKTVREFVLADSNKLKTAVAIYESWPAIKNEVCKTFLERLRCAIERKAKEFAPDITVICEYTGEYKYGNGIWMYRECWTPYETNQSVSNGFTRTKIAMVNENKGPNGWCIGVVSPMSKVEMAPAEKERRQRLDEKLGGKLGPGKSTDWWPWVNWVEGDKGNWDSLLPDLHEECLDNNNTGKITEYFVDTLIEISKEAIPIINKIETRDNKT